MKKFMVLLPIIALFMLFVGANDAKAQYPAYRGGQIVSCQMQLYNGYPMDYSNPRCRMRISNAYWLNGNMVMHFDAEPCYVNDPYCGANWMYQQERFRRQYLGGGGAYQSSYYPGNGYGGGTTVILGIRIGRKQRR